SSFVGRRPAVRNEPAVAAAREQKRFLPAIGIGLHRAEENHVIATIISIGGPALKIRYAVGEDRSVAEARPPVDTGEFVVRGFGKFVRKCLLRYPANIDSEVAGVPESA